MTSLQVINFIKLHFLQIIGGLLAAALIGVAIYAHNSEKAQRPYTVSINVYGDTVKSLTFSCKGFPRLVRYKHCYELTDFSTVVYKSKDSVAITNIKQD